MFKSLSTALLASACVFHAGLDRAAAQGFQQPTVIYSGPPQQTAPVRTAYVERSRMGGGFIEFLFGDPQGGRGLPPPEQPMYQQQPSYYGPQQSMPGGLPQQGLPDEEAYEQTQRPLDPKYEKQIVDYDGRERPGTIVIDTPNKFLYLVQNEGRALRYGIGVGRPGFTWAGVKTISGLDAAGGDAGAPAGSAAAHGRRTAEPARRPRDVSGLVALPDPRLQRTMDDRDERLVGMHQDAQR